MIVSFTANDAKLTATPKPISSIKSVSNLLILTKLREIVQLLLSNIIKIRKLIFLIKLLFGRPPRPRREVGFPLVNPRAGVEVVRSSFPVQTRLFFPQSGSFSC